MRTIWLASTALLMSAAFASAQTSGSTSTPAPTGATASPQVTPPGSSPGNMGPSSSSSGTPAMSGTTATNGTSAPGADGAVSAPAVTGPGSSAGRMAPGGSASATPTTPMAAPGPSGTESAMNSAPATSGHPWHHHWAQSGSLPAEASATTYLHIAKSAISHHNVMLADDALSHAETRLLDRSVPQGGIAADSSPSIQSIESARQALHAGNYSKASADTKQAAMSASSM